jgi:acyl dehydratase
MEKYVGTEAKPHTLNLGPEVVRRFLEAIGDTNPLWMDDVFASHTRYAGTIVPPHIFTAIMTIARCSPKSGVVPIPVPEAPLPRRNVLEGEETWTFFAPLRIGDVITSHTKLSDVKRREGRLGEMFILTYESETVNQKGQRAATSVNTIVNY